MKRSVQLLLCLSAGILIQPIFVTRASGDNCYSDCVVRYECYSSHPYAGSSCYDLCRESCRPDGWGAIAYSWKDKISGWSFALGDKHTAEQVARQYCANEHGSSCAIEATYFNSCGAVAADGDLVAWGTSGTKGQAEQRALAECAKIGGKSCVVEVSACSARSGNSETRPASPPPPAKGNCVGRHRLQHARYGGRMGAGQGRPRQRGKRGHGRLLPTWQVVRPAGHLQQNLRSAGSGPRFCRYGDFHRPARGIAESHRRVQAGGRHQLRASHYVLLVLTVPAACTGDLPHPLPG